MPLYQVPLWKRSARVGTNGFHEIIIAVDNVGLFVKYDNKEELDPSNIRRALIARKRTHCIVEANRPEDVISTFQSEWDGANTGGELPESKALRIDDSNTIIELPECERLSQSSRQEYICGNETQDGSGEYGMCILEGYSSPLSCPIAEHMEHISQLRSKSILPVREIEGFQFILFDNVQKKCLQSS